MAHVAENEFQPSPSLALLPISLSRDDRPSETVHEQLAGVRPVTEGRPDVRAQLAGNEFFLSRHSRSLV